MNQPLKNLPAEERPRERLARFGSEALSTIELLAILLGSGTQNRSVLQLAAELLAHFQSLRALSEATLQELQEVKGIGAAKAIQLQAAFALYHRREEISHLLLDAPEKVYASIRLDLEEQKVEVLMILLRDVRRRLIHREILAKGTLTELLLHPREVYHAAIKHRAHSLIIAHNHPSGDPTPSKRDQEMTQILSGAGKVIGIPLADHLIIGRDSFVSFCERGLMQKQEPY
jgi:DNA repair protein RadC